MPVHVSDPTHDGGVDAGIGIAVADLQIVARRDGGVDDPAQGIHPVVVALQQRSGQVMQFEHRVGELAGEQKEGAETRVRGLTGRRASDDESPDQNMLLRFRPAAVSRCFQRGGNCTSRGRVSGIRERKHSSLTPGCSPSRSGSRFDNTHGRGCQGYLEHKSKPVSVHMLPVPVPWPEKTVIHPVA